MEMTKDECRDAVGVTFLETLVQDVRHGFRTMLRTPAFHNCHRCRSGSRHRREYRDLQRRGCRAAAAARLSRLRIGSSPF